MSAKPTPGPWTLTTVPTQVGICHKIGPFPDMRGDGKPTHACIYVDGVYRAKHEPTLLANACLIVAAPDLLEALKEFEVVTCEGGCGGSGKAPDDGENACRTCGGTGLEIRGGDPHAIRAAIAKAEGK